MRLCVFILLGLLFVFSAESSFAQKQLKYIPRAVRSSARGTAGGTTRVPKVINPNWPVEVQRRIAASGGGIVVNTTPTSPNLPPGNVNSAPVPAATSASKSVRIFSELYEQFLTGPQALEIFRPGWKSELLLAGFTESQLTAITEAFAETDELLFELDETGRLAGPLGNEWEYSNRFALVLTEKTSLNEGQVKTLFGKFSRLDDVFTWLNLQTFLLTHEGRNPKTNAPGAEGTLARKVRYNLDKRDGRKMNPEVEEYVYGNMPAQLKNQPANYGPRGHAAKRTPDEVLEQTLQFIRDNNRFPSRDAKDPTETSLRVAFDNACRKINAQNLKDGTSQRLVALKAQWVKEIDEVRTPQEILEQVKQYLTVHNGEVPTQSSPDKEAAKVRRLWDTVYVKYKNVPLEEIEDDAARELVELHREVVKKKAANRDPQEILEQVKAYRAAHDGQNPSQKSDEQEVRSIRNAWEDIYKKYNDVPLEDIEDSAVRELVQLHRETVKEIAASRTPQEILEQVKQYRAEHNGQNPSYYSDDKNVKSMYVAWKNICRRYKDVPLEDIEDPAARELVQLHRETIGVHD